MAIVSQFLLVEEPVVVTRKPRKARPTGVRPDPAAEVALTLQRYPNVMAHLAE